MAFVITSSLRLFLAQDAPAPSPVPYVNPTAQALAIGMSIIVAYLALPGLLLWLLWKFGRRRGGDGEPRCGKCGYLVRGLSALNCPECGADLREVGITRTAPVMLWWQVTLWTIGCFAAALAAAGATQLCFGLMTGKFDGPLIETMAFGGIGVVALAWFVGLLLLIQWRLSQAPLTDSRSLEPSAPGGGASAADANRAAKRPAPRTLTIMFIDMHDYTARTASSSRGAIIELIQRLRKLAQPLVAEHGGRIVKTMGDGLLVTFDSPTDAVLCGRAIQRRAAQADVEGGARSDDDTGADAERAAPGDALSLRIGVTTGEVALEDNDVYGEPVNVASRIQQLAAPGEVYFSEATWHAMTKSEVAHEEVGAFELKGVAGKARVFRAS